MHRTWRSSPACADCLCPVNKESWEEGWRKQGVCVCVCKYVCECVLCESVCVSAYVCM